MEIYQMTAVETAKKIKAGEISSAEVTAEYLARIKEKNKGLYAYITVCEKEALESAGFADSNMLCGVPVSVKDNLCTEKIRTTCASEVLDNYVPAYDAHCVKKLKEAGLPILGKVNLEEFAMGSFGLYCPNGQTKNPLGEEYVPGGSSCGSSASVAAGLAAASVGTDTGGSVRIPASFCGLVGFKPSYGAISRYGLIAYASSLDTVGTVTRSVGDARLLSSVMFGRDVHDMTSENIPADTDEDIDICKLKIAFSERDLLCAETEISDICAHVAEELCKRGARCVDDTIFGDAQTDFAYKVLACAEATSNLARYDGIKYGRGQSLFGDEVRRRIEFGNFVLREENFEEYYVASIAERKRVLAKLDDIFGRADVILSPLCDFAVPTYKEAPSCRADRFTVAANFAGVPAISIPAGRDRRGMPVSIQLMSKKFSDARLLKIAEKIEYILREVEL